MASTKHCLCGFSLIYIFVWAIKLGRAYDYPHLGAAGAVANQYVPQAEVGEAYGYYPGGNIGTGTAILVNKALGCFNDKYIYNQCDEEHRLTEDGEIRVTPEYTDQYCNGPCLSETRHVLNCINGILKTFVFYNRATVKDLGETIEYGCSNGPRRGNFGVFQHIQSDKAVANVVFTPVLYMLMAMTMAWFILF